MAAVVVYVVLLGLSLCLLGGCHAAGETVLRTWDAPAGIRRSDRFGARVRRPGGEWHELFVYCIQVDHPHNCGPYDSSMVHFDFSSRVEIEVTYADAVESVEFRPASFGIEARRTGSTLCFGLTQVRDFPRKFVLRVNDSWNEGVLHVLTNPPEEAAPEPSQVDHYFGPGRIHEVGTLDVSRTDGATVYVAGGAVLRGDIRADAASNACIVGRGILDGGIIRSGYGAENVRLDGLILINTTRWAVVFEGQRGVGRAGPRHVEITNLSIITHGVRGRRSTPDGIHLDAAVDCRARGCFVRACDDLLNVDARYARRDTHGVRFENMVLWCDRGHCMIVGYKGTPADRESILDVTFRNIDVINQYTGAVMQMFVADNLTVRDIVYDDIRVMPFQDPSNTKLFEIDMRFNHWAQCNGLAVRNITYRNIDYAGGGERPGAFIGKGPLRTIEGLRFVNYRRAGRLVRRVEDGHLELNDHVRDVQVLGCEADAGRQPPRVDVAAPHDLGGPVPYTAALRSWRPPRINFDAPPEARAGEPYVLSDIRLLDSGAMAAVVRCRRVGHAAWRKAEVAPTGEGRWRAVVPAEMTAGPFEHVIEIQGGDAQTVQEPADGAIRIVPDRETPSAVGRLRATRVGAAGVTLRWAPARDDRRVARYDVYRRQLDGEALKLAELPAEERAFSTDDVSAGAELSIGVSAVDAAGRAGEITFVSVNIPREDSPLPAPDHYLSDLPLARATAGWGRVERDRNSDLKPIRLGGRTYRKGLGVHADSEVVCALRPDRRRFVARVGIDDLQGRRGSIVARIYADDVLLDQSPRLVGGQSPWPVDVAIPARSRRLRLVVDDGYDTIEGDLADWAYAGFLTQ